MKKILLLICAAALIFGGCAPSQDHYERTEKVMGTLVTLKADGTNAKAAVEESFDKIFALVEEVKADVRNLNEAAGNGEFVKVSRDVFEMLRLGQEYSELTDGAFDVTIGAAVDLWRTARKNKTLPAQAEIDAAKNLVGYRHLHLNPADCSARLDKAGMKINLGGLGKGYGVDLAREIFAAHGVKDGIIDFGTSSIFVFGQKKIGIKNPRGEHGVSDVLELEDSALSTSGDYEQFFILDGRRYHHILDPKTCQPTDNGVASVSVVVAGSVENCATVADILSTSAVVLGKDRAQTLLQGSTIYHKIVSPADGL